MTTPNLYPDSLFDLPEATVVSRRNQMAQLLQERHPSIYVKRGVVYDYVLHPGSMFNTAHSLLWDRVWRSGSLVAVAEDPELADEAILEALASNFLVTRLPGQTATGNVTIVLSQSAQVTIPAGALLTANGKKFTTAIPFVSRDSEAGLITAGDRLLSQLSDGTYAFVIDVTAVEEGAASRLVKNAVVVPDDPVPYFVKAYATNDFLGGYDQESLTSLTNRLLPGQAARALSGPVNMTAMLVNNPLFERVVADSVLGMGDAEMFRDKHSIFPGTTGGKMDWYVQTQELPQSVLLTKTATYMEDAGDGHGVWQFSIGRDDAPGFYDVTSIVQTDEADHLGSYPIESDNRMKDMSSLENDGFLPDVVTPLEAAYSRFQTTVIRFKDTDTPVTGLTPFVSTREYAVTVRAMPQIADIQDLVLDRSVRNPMGDCLVKAPVPCFLQVSCTVQLLPGQVEPDLDATKAEMAQMVNRTGFLGVLPASRLTRIIQQYLVGGAYVDAVDVLGRLLRPDGTFRLIRSTETLQVPDEPERMVSARTVVFFLSPDDIAITVQTASVPIT